MATITSYDQAAVDALAGLPGPDVTCWGDSLTQMGYPAFLAAGLASRTVRNSGVGGEPSQGIAARQGGSPYWLLPAGGSIPASGPVNVTLSPAGVWPLLQGSGVPSADGGTLTGSFAGVPGTLTLTQVTPGSYTHDPGDTYQFTRTTTGAAVACTRPAPFWTDYSQARRGDIVVLWAGRNNVWDQQQILGDLQAMTRHLDRARTRFIVLNIPPGATDSSGTLTNVSNVNLALAQIYGERYVDIVTYLQTYGLADAQMLTTAGDSADIAAGYLPRSLRNTGDALHPNNSGRAIIANLVGQRLRDLGWTPDWLPQAIPLTPQLLYSETFDTGVGSEWLGTHGATVSQATTGQHAGTGALQINHSTDIASSAKFATGLQVTGGRALNLTLWVKRVSGTSTIRVLAQEYAGTTYIGNVQNTVTPTTGTWQQMTVAGALMASTTNLFLEINKGGNSADTDVVLVDDISLTQT